MVKMQGTSSPFPLWFSHFPFTCSVTELPDSKIRLHVFENYVGICPRASPSFTTLMAYSSWRLLTSQFLVKEYFLPKEAFYIYEKNVLFLTKKYGRPAPICGPF